MWKTFYYFLRCYDTCQPIHFTSFRTRNSLLNLIKINHRMRAHEIHNN